VTHNFVSAKVEVSMRKQNPIDLPQQKVCYVLLGAAAVMLTLGAYMGLVRHGSAILVFVTLGVSIALFTSALLVLLNPTVHGLLTRGKSQLQPEAKVEPQAEAETHNMRAASADLATLMNTTVGELFLAAARKDPDGAKRIFDQTAIRGETPTTARSTEQATDQA
jgi:hypothetical protein